MSYARFGWDDSDVYVYLDVGGYLRCCGCPLEDDARFLTTAGMLAHLDQHEAAGHVVPASCRDGLRHDEAENDAWLAEAGDG